MMTQAYDEDLKGPEYDSPNASAEERFGSPSSDLTDDNSPGIKRIEAIARHIKFKDRVVLFIAIFILAYVYTLDNTLRYVYQPNATASYASHSLLSTVATVRAVIAATAQPTAAKIADVFGRVEVLCVTTIFYVAGTLIETFAQDVGTFATGAILYQIGWTGVVLLIEVLVADITSLRSRLFFSYLPAAPYLINTWVSGNIGAVVLANSSWRWGIGMWAIIYPVVVLPVVACLFLVHRRAKKFDDLSTYRTPYQTYGARGLIVGLFWQLDLVGIVLLVAMLGCILVPFTLAGDGQGWSQAHILTPIIIGVLLIPGWVAWEAKSSYPLVPFEVIKDRAVWGALGMACMFNLIWTLQGDYLYTVTIVAFNQTVLSATRIGGLYTFCSVLTGVLTGVVVYFVRRLKPFILAGTTLYLAAFGLLIRFRGGSGQNNLSGLIGAQVLLGIAGGLFPYPGLASIQAATRHEHVAVVTGLYLAIYNVGSAFGNAISGAIWRQVLPGSLSRQLSQVSSNATLAGAAFSDPFTFVASYPDGTPENEAAVVAYRHTQRLLCSTGICLCLPLIAFSLCLRNPVLGSAQSLPNAEKEASAPDSNESKEGSQG